MINLQRRIGPVFLALLFLQASHFGTTNLASAQVPGSAVASADERKRGIALYQQDKFSEAAKLLRKALKQNSSDHIGWYYLGLALLRQPKEMKEATKAFETALKLSPNFAAARTGLGFSFLGRNKSSDAIREANLALRIEPNRADAHYVMGVARLRLGAREDALQEAETAIRLDPEYSAGYLLKSQALVSFFGDVLIREEDESEDTRKTRYSQAADALEKYLQLHPDVRDEQTWREQLESLQFYAASRQTQKDSAGIFSSKELTTKARVLAKPEPQYTEAARGAAITGTVVLRAVFTSGGKVKYFLVLKGLPYGLTEASIRVARKIKFIPATIDGRPVSMFIQLEYNFNLY